MFRPLGVIFRSSLGTYFYINFFAVLFFICIRDSVLQRNGTYFLNKRPTKNTIRNIYVANHHNTFHVHTCTCRGRFSPFLQATQALRVCKGIALVFLGHGTRRVWGVSVMPRPQFTPRKDPLPIVQEAGWAPGPVWTGAENLSHHRDSIPGPSSP